MKNRGIAWMLAVVSLLSLLAGCGGENLTTQPETEGVKLWHAYNTENLMRDVQYPEKMESRDHTLRLYGIRGDVESVQLMITPEADVESYDFTMDELVSKDGKTFSAEQFEVLSQWYVNVEASYNTQAYYGYYPDALVPLQAVKRQRLNSIAAGENQGLWINATIPENAAPGFYTGTAKLELDDGEYDIPVELTVYDALMPEQVHPRSCFLIWYDYMAKAEGSGAGAIAQAYFDVLVENRCMPMYPEPAIYGDYEAFVQWALEKVVNNPKISTYALPYSYELDENEHRILSREKTMQILTVLAQKNVALRQSGDETTNLFEKAYFYLGAIIDEPTGEALERVKICDLIVSECKFAVADAYLKDYPDLYNALAGLPHVVTTAYNEDLLGSDTTGGVQAWCPQFQHWHTQAQRDNYYARQNTTDRLMGEEAWWYGCNNPPAPYPTYHLDDDLIGSRVLSWMQYDYGSEGNLYWCVNVNSETMWETADDIGGAVCEGTLLYPAAKFGLQEPCTTLRLQSIREGQEDYEYLWMVEQAIIGYNEKEGTNHDPKALMAPLYDGLYDGMIPERDNAETFQERRLTLLEVLQQILSDPAAGIEKLQSMQS